MRMYSECKKRGETRWSDEKASRRRRIVNLAWRKHSSRGELVWLPTIVVRRGECRRFETRNRPLRRLDLLSENARGNALRSEDETGCCVYCFCYTASMVLALCLLNWEYVQSTYNVCGISVSPRCFFFFFF